MNKTLLVIALSIASAAPLASNLTSVNLEGNAVQFDQSVEAFDSAKTYEEKLKQAYIMERLDNALYGPSPDLKDFHQCFKEEIQEGDNYQVTFDKCV